MGDTVHSQFKLEAQGKAPQQKISEEDWITVEETHEPIISKEMFDEVQQRIRDISDGKIPPKRWIPEFNGPRDNIYKGKIFCGICGRTETYKHRGNWVVYRCASIGHVDIKCGAHAAHMRDINGAVVDILNIRYGLGLEKVTKALVDKYIKKVVIEAHDIIYVELTDDHKGEKADGKKE